MFLFLLFGGLSNIPGIFLSVVWFTKCAFPVCDEASIKGLSCLICCGNKCSDVVGFLFIKSSNLALGTNIMNSLAITSRSLIQVAGELVYFFVFLSAVYFLRVFHRL